MLRHRNGGRSLLSTRSTKSCSTGHKKCCYQLSHKIYDENDGLHGNLLYTATEAYIAARVSLNIQCVTATQNPSDRNIKLTMETNECYMDTFKGVKFRWCLASKKMAPRVVYNDDGDRCATRTDQRSFELTFNRNHYNLAVNEYLPFIREMAKTMRREDRMLKLYGMEYTSWKSVNMDHPSTFATLAMDAGVKERVIRDLDRFVERREYYRRLGKAWKRGYLLFGPPGTGKSSLIAAMANYLKFDIYDLELTAVKSNEMLRSLLMATANCSILVVEDIDCSIQLRGRADHDAHSDQEQKVTLLGFLNFVDGLWSSCGDERIIVFTTNHKERLDPALLRPGRMDVHIEMGYCTPCGFRVMASTYLGITEHNSFERIDYLLSKLEVTPAEIGEQLMREGEPDTALDGLIQFLDEKLEKNEQEEGERCLETSAGCSDYEKQGQTGSNMI
ncbi:AAA-ATPase At3g50940-like [Bidens hawaiensis]|uniref:AAA-ATPase At3g50940-like n=1 Tax=Bidens hawaiensis TaxID=980011 RepID=UPI0040498F4E